MCKVKVNEQEIHKYADKYTDFTYNIFNEETGHYYKVS